MNEIKIETFKLKAYELEEKLELELSELALLSQKLSKYNSLKNIENYDIIYDEYNKKKNIIENLFNELDIIINENSLKEKSSMIIINKYQTIKTQNFNEYKAILTRTKPFIKRYQLLSTNSGVSSSLSSLKLSKKKKIFEKKK